MSSTIKNSKKIFTSPGGDTTLPNRVTTLENNEYKITYFAEISSSTGTITIPTGATILLDQFFGGVDAYVCTIQNGQPTGLFPQTSGGVTVDVSSFDALGNYTLSGTPSSYPVALIYILKIKAKDYSNLDITKILDLEEVNVNYRIPLETTITSSATPTPNSNTTDIYTITALAVDAVFESPTGNPSQGQALLIRVKDNGTARALGFNAAYRFSTDLPAPTTTVISKTLYLAFVYNTTDSKWDCIGVLNNF